MVVGGWVVVVVWVCVWGGSEESGRCYGRTDGRGVVSGECTRTAGLMQPSAEEGVPPTEAALRAELASLKLRQLYKRAAQEGVPEAALEEAEEGPDPKGAVIALIVERNSRAAAAAHLRAELASLKLRAVFRRAEEMGVPEASLEAAEEADDPKGAAIDLILGLRADLLAAHTPSAAQPEPDRGAEPEPEPAMREVHSAREDPVVAVDVAGAADWGLAPIQPSKTSDFLSALCIFGSMRFPVPPEARLLFAALQAAGVHLKIVDMRAGQDIDKEVYEWIEHCRAFLAFGTKNYGEDTGNSACTYNEVKFAQAKRKNIILLRMIPWEAEFAELQARVLFNRNMLTLEWQQGQAMPPSLVGELLKAMDLPPTGVAGSPAALAHQTRVAEAAKAQAQAQIAQAQASAAAAKAEAEAMQAQAEAAQAMAIAAAEEEAARRMQEEARAVQIAERERQAEAAQRELRARTMSELETADPRRVIEILKLPLADAEVQQTGWSAIWRRSDAGPGKQTEYGRAFASAGGLEAMVVALRDYQASAHVVENVLHSAFVLARDDSNCAAIGSGGGIEAVVAAMRSHVGSAVVQEQGCSALVNLSSTAANVKVLRRSGGTKVLQEARARFRDHSEIVRLAEKALGRL